jgi:hypothetical protein
MPLAADLTLRSSRMLSVFVTSMIICCGSGIGLWLLELSVQIDALELAPIVALVSGVWLGSCVIGYRWLRAQHGVRRLMINADGLAVLHGVRLLQPGRVPSLQSSTTSRLAQATMVWPSMMILRVLSDAMSAPTLQRSEWLVVLRDSADGREYRALAVWMQWLRRKGGSDAMPGRST